MGVVVVGRLGTPRNFVLTKYKLAGTLIRVYYCQRSTDRTMSKRTTVRTIYLTNYGARRSPGQRRRRIRITAINASTPLMLVG